MKIPMIIASLALSSPFFHPHEFVRSRNFKVKAFNNPLYEKRIYPGVVVKFGNIDFGTSLEIVDKDRVKLSSDWPLIVAEVDGKKFFVESVEGDKVRAAEYVKASYGEWSIFFSESGKFLVFVDDKLVYSLKDINVSYFSHGLNEGYIEMRIFDFGKEKVFTLLERDNASSYLTVVFKDGKIIETRLEGRVLDFNVELYDANVLIKANSLFGEGEEGKFEKTFFIIKERP